MVSTTILDHEVDLNWYGCLTFDPGWLLEIICKPTGGPGSETRKNSVDRQAMVLDRVQHVLKIIPQKSPSPQGIPRGWTKN